MPLDHYISQVYLRNFYSPSLGRLHAVRKADHKVFTPRSGDVCRLESGNTNPFLQDPRAIEEFLKSIEPRYNSVLSRLRNSAIDAECVFVVAGLLAYFLVCSPGGMRMRSTPLKPILKEATRILDRVGKLPPPPLGLDGRTMSDLIDAGLVDIKIDQRFSQAVGVSHISEYIAVFGNFCWEILHNPFTDIAFFSSDYPIALEDSTHPQVQNKVFSLAPDLAVRIQPDFRPRVEDNDFSFPNFGCRFKTLRRSAIGEINMRIVRCAETIVFHRDDGPAIQEFIKRHSQFRIETCTERLDTGNGAFLIASERIVPIKRTND